MTAILANFTLRDNKETFAIDVSSEGKKKNILEHRVLTENRTPNSPSAKTDLKKELCRCTNINEDVDLAELITCTNAQHTKAETTFCISWLEDRTLEEKPRATLPGFGQRLFDWC